MAREPQKTDFIVEVEGLGNFTFARRTMRDEIKIQREFARYIDGVEPTTWLAQVGGWLSDLRILLVSAPEDWMMDIDGNPITDLMDVDPLDEDTYAKLANVHAALREKEGSFRRKSGKDGQA